MIFRETLLSGFGIECNHYANGEINITSSLNSDGITTQNGIYKAVLSSTGLDFYKNGNLTKSYPNQ